MSSECGLRGERTKVTETYLIIRNILSVKCQEDNTQLRVFGMDLATGLSSSQGGGFVPDAGKWSHSRRAGFVQLAPKCPIFCWREESSATDAST